MLTRKHKASKPLVELIRARYSCRDFAPKILPLADLAALLQSSYGIEGLRHWPNRLAMHQRNAPSAGDLYPLELYLIAEHVADLPPGQHRYDPQAAALEQLSTHVSLNSLIAELMRQVYVANAACLVFIAAHLPRTLDKYGARGYRHLLFEAGHVAQNLCLLAWARRS